jgi:hypothetical protein
LEPDLIQKLYAIRSKHRRLSITDLAAYLLAKDLDATLLTGDWGLSELAAESGISVHGILWILDELVFFQSLRPRQASNALNLILNGGARLPQKECQKRLRMWSTED